MVAWRTRSNKATWHRKNETPVVEGSNEIKIPAMTLKTAHSVGLSGITICIGIQNGGFAVELWKNEKQQ